MDIGIQGICVVDDRSWFSLAKGNGLCSMDLETGEVKYITSIPGEDITGAFLYEDIKHYRHQLILIPGNAKEIAVYDMDIKKISKIPVYAEHLKYKDGYDGFGKFHSALIVDEWIYFVPCHFPAIVKMNMTTFEIFYLEDWIKDILPYLRTDRAFFRKDVVSDGNGMIYLTSLYYNMVLAVDIRSDQTFIVRKGFIGDGCGGSCITYKNNMFVLSERNQKKISLFDRRWNLKQQIYLPNILSQKYWIDHIQSIVWGNYIFYIPFGTNMMLRLDMDTNSLDVVRQWESDDVPRYDRAWLYRDKLYCYKDMHIDVFDIEGYLTGSIQIDSPGDLENDMITELVTHGDILVETKMIQLAGFLKALGKSTWRSDIDEHLSSGDRIYAKIKDL